MTDNEIEKMARIFAESENPEEDYGENIVERDMDLYISKDEATRVLRWLAKDHCIVSKTQTIELHDEIHGAIMCAKDEDDWDAAAHYILDEMPTQFNHTFGMELFGAPHTGLFEHPNKR